MWKRLGVCYEYVHNSNLSQLVWSLIAGEADQQLNYLNFMHGKQWSAKWKDSKLQKAKASCRWNVQFSNQGLTNQSKLYCKHDNIWFWSCGNCTPWSVSCNLFYSFSTIWQGGQLVTFMKDIMQTRFIVHWVCSHFLG